jgi:hypothetical protein
VNILIVTPSGQEAGYEANGTPVNQVGANLTGPDSEPETVTISTPAIGTYQILVFGKSSAGTGSPFTITVESSSGGSLSYSGTAESGSESSLLVNLSSTGSLTSTTGGGLPATEFFGSLGVITLLGLSAVLIFRVRRGRRGTPPL